MKITITLFFAAIFPLTIIFADYAIIDADRQNSLEYNNAVSVGTLVQQPAACTYSLSPTSAGFGFGGGRGSFLVTTEPGCLVNATTSSSNNGFIYIETETGDGSTRIFFTVSGSLLDRTGTIIVNGQEFTVFQSAACNPSISFDEANFPAAGGDGIVRVKTGANCQYTATTGDSFITFTNGTVTGTGSGIITFSVAPNAEYRRQGSIVVDNTSGSVSQAGACDVTLTPASATFTRDGGTGSFTVTTLSNCTYTATTSSSFITMQNIGGTGSGVINYTVAPNTELGRTGNINFPGFASFRITQLAGTVSSRPAFDFDGDLRSDISLFRPGNGIWYISPSQSGNFYALPFGQNGDLPVPADYDGDGKTDPAVWRGTTTGAQAYFYILNSADNSFRTVPFGTNGDIPISGEWDGDGKADPAVYRGAATAGGQSYFYYRPSSRLTVDIEAIQLGTFGDKPIRADFGGDGILDATVWQPSTARWTIRPSGVGSIMQPTFGLSTDIPVPADYDGDGRANVAVFRPSNGTWYVLASRSTTSFTAVQFGQTGDVPVPADYDGEGRVDYAVFRAGTWYVERSTGGLVGLAFGSPSDVPVPNAFIR